MSLIDLILNLAGLMIWAEWRSGNRKKGMRVPAQMLVATLQRAEPSRKGWLWPASLVALVVVRGLFYKQIGSGVGWKPSIPLGAISLTFRSDWTGKILLFSFLSFLASLGVFYSSLLLLSSLNQKITDSSPQQRWVRSQLGRVVRWPLAVRLLLPWLTLTGLWLVLTPVSSRLDLIASPDTFTYALESSMVVGLGGYLGWKYLIAGILLLYILNSYVYMGGSTFWNYINLSTQTLIRPVSCLRLRAGRFDFAPVLVMVLVFVLSHFGELGLTWIYGRLPPF